jgi:hypothetical protein
MEDSRGQVDGEFDQWAILELSGRKVIAGRVSGETIGGVSLVRVDVPGVENGSIKRQPFTRYYGAVAIYSITPVSEEVARMAVRHYTPRPITVYIPELTLPARASEPLDDDGYDEP